MVWMSLTATPSRSRACWTASVRALLRPRAAAAWTPDVDTRMDTVMVSGVPLTVAVPVVVMVPAFDGDPDAAGSDARTAWWPVIDDAPDPGSGFDVREAECPHPPSASIEAAAITPARGISRVV